MSHRACCHTCYTVQLMHYSHIKTQSLQHLKPIKCQKRVCKYKTPTCFGIFSRPSSMGPPLCFVPLLFLPLICVRWVRIITQYVAACVCHLCAFGVLVWTDKNTKHTHMTYTCGHILRNNTNSTNANQFVLLRSMWPHVYVICVCLVFFSEQTRTSKHTHMTYTCGHILRTNMNSMNANQREEQ